MKVLSGADEAASVVNSVDEEGWAPIHSAASIGNSEILDILISLGNEVSDFLAMRFSDFFFFFLSCQLLIHRRN